MGFARTSTALSFLSSSPIESCSSIAVRWPDSAFFAVITAKVTVKGPLGLFCLIDSQASNTLQGHVRRGVVGIAPKAMVIGTVRNRKNIAGEITSRVIALGKDVPHIEAGRLRTTWIAELMTEAIPIQVILHAAGLQSARTLTDLARRYSQDEMTAHLYMLKGGE